ncbi:MGMT family protein [Halomarina ordinaria]|uniref:MGMT family protein n=1 Tax=Halomarina ordinaria TaxID=3033939 RepID=A0ABD5U7E0_9EURY|nr:MGMT family protein [Halomarina sp. PSRA2]
MDDESGIYAREFESLECFVQLGVASGRVISVSFPGTPEDGATADHPLLDRIAAYLEGTHDDFADVTVALTVPTAHREVLEAVRDVPYGEQVSVERLARSTPGLDADDEDDHAVVRDALAGNPTPILVPDHRVRDGPSAAPPAVEQRLRSFEGL